jgi:predicted exporter
VAGFALLLFSELPFIRQLGTYVGIGLLCALGAALVYFATVRDPFLETRGFRGGRALPEPARRGLRRALLVAWVAALPGLAFLSWRDDIRDLDVPSPELQRDDARIRERFGGGGERSVYLTYGDSWTEARTALDSFERWLASHGGDPGASINLGSIVPTEAERLRAAAFVEAHPEFPERLRTALAGAGFEPDGFEPFFAAYPRSGDELSAGAVGGALGAVQTRLTGPLGLLLHRGEPFSWFVTLTRDAPAGEPPAGVRTVGANQLQSLNRVFARYRESALGLSLTGLAIVGLGVFLTYGFRDGLRIFAIPGGACAGVFGMFGWLEVPLNLFHLLGAFLGVCMTHNYAIFSATSAYRHEAVPVSVRVSALTTAASFGVLATSGIPVVSALGLTVAAMVVTALLAIELEHLAGLGGGA